MLKRNKKDSESYEGGDKDGREHQFNIITLLLFTLSCCVMLLSVVATANFGLDYEEEFEFVDPHLPYRNSTKIKNQSV